MNRTFHQGHPLAMVLLLQWYTECSWIASFRPNRASLLGKHRHFLLSTHSTLFHTNCISHIQLSWHTCALHPDPTLRSGCRLSLSLATVCHSVNWKLSCALHLVFPNFAFIFNLDHLLTSIFSLSLCHHLSTRPYQLISSPYLSTCLSSYRLRHRMSSPLLMFASAPAPPLGEQDHASRQLSRESSTHSIYLIYL